MTDPKRQDVENDIYDIMEWFDLDIELPTFQEAAETQTGMGMMQGARIAAYRAAVKLRQTPFKVHESDNNELINSLIQIAKEHYNNPLLHGILEKALSKAGNKHV